MIFSFGVRSGAIFIGVQRNCTACSVETEHSKKDAACSVETAHSQKAVPCRGTPFLVSERADFSFGVRRLVCALFIGVRWLGTACAVETVHSKKDAACAVETTHSKKAVSCRGTP